MPAMYNQMQQMFTQAAGFARRPKVIMWAVIIIIALVALWLLPKVFGNMFSEIKKNSAESNDGSFENEMAGRYYAAGNTWGGMGEDEAEIVKLALESKGRTGFNRISKVYKALYGTSLETEVNKWLDDPTERAQFYKNLGE